MSDVTEHEDDQETILTDEGRHPDLADDATEEEVGLDELQVNIEEATRRFNERFPPTELRGNVTTRRSEGITDPLTSIADDLLSLPAIAEPTQLTPYMSGARSVDTPARTTVVPPIARSSRPTLATPGASRLVAPSRLASGTTPRVLNPQRRLTSALRGTQSRQGGSTQQLTFDLATPSRRSRNEFIRAAVRQSIGTAQPTAESFADTKDDKVKERDVRKRELNSDSTGPIIDGRPLPVLRQAKPVATFVPSRQ